jgi:transposase
MCHVGIDVSKAFLDVALLAGEKPIVRRVANTVPEIADLMAWLQSHAVSLVAVEATGAYHAPVLAALLAADVPTTRVNPAQIKAFRQMRMTRNKTDREDAILIAHFAAQYESSLERVHPAEPRQERLRSLVGYREGLIKRRTMLTNQQAAATFRGDTTIDGFLTSELAQLATNLAAVDVAIQSVLAELPEAAVLDAMPGVGWRTVAVVLAYLPVAVWGQAKAAAAYAGVHPAQSSSGTRATSRMSKQGHARLRHALFCAALPALRWNETLKAVFDRHHANGKAKMDALGVVMHKLLRHLMGRLRRYYAEQAALASTAGA